MNIINYISSAAIPIVILIIVLIGVSEKKKVYDIFVDGAKEGIQIVFNIFPTLLGLFVAIGVLRSSGILTLIIDFIEPVTNLLKIPSEVMPLAMLRPISGSASMAVATDIMNNYGVDSKIRTNCFHNYGLYRNNFLYNCSIHKLYKDKKNKICISCSINSRYSWNDCVCNNLGNYVVKFFLTFLKKDCNMYLQFFSKEVKYVF